MQTLEETGAVDGFVSSASFWFPEALIESAWHEHAPFAFWLIAALKPRQFVELGTHHGFSYLSFCQAAERSGLDASGYAVDTWRGDEHAGFYDDEVYTQLRDRHDRRYGGFSRLVRSTFDEALSYFAEKSVDLLHIDGRHFYEDVKHDFESWKNKLSDRAIVLLHDTNVRERGFGVFRLWEELREQYPAFEFLHGHGLGVLGIGTELPEALNLLFAAAPDAGRSARIREIYARLGSAIEERYLLAGQATALRRREDELLRQRGENETTQQLLLEQRAKLATLERTAEEQLRQIAALQTELTFTREARQKAERDLAAERNLAGRQVREIECLAAVRRSAEEANVRTEQRLAEMQALLNDMQRRAASSRWLLRAVASKAIHAPRDMSRQLRRSWRKRFRAPTPVATSSKNAFDFRQLYNKQYRKYASSRLLLWLEPALPRSFASRMRNRMAKHAAAATAPTIPPPLSDQLFPPAKSPSDEYVPYREHATDQRHRVKAIAFYLPQFHPIAENDQWWGKGFTEWTNVSKAVPQFVGHYQPRLPGELSFYDLRVPEVMKRQIELAKNYGVHGFCFHYYWFTGRKRLLERPLNQFLADASLDFPFCICWANENWTRRWDGSETEILMEQRHEPQDDLQFIEDLAPYLEDPRYIRVNGRPLIIVYRANILPEPRNTAKVWRDYCTANGIADPWLVAAQPFGIGDPRPYGFDAAVEFPPHNLLDVGPSTNLEFLNPAFEGKVYSYEKVVEKRAAFSWPEYPLYKTIVPSWDNEARRPGRGTIFQGAMPSLYKRWFAALSHKTDERYQSDEEKLVFINAWNEWAEGAYLEPDRRFGYGYLQATREVLDTPEDATRRIAIISHDAYAHGAQHLALHLSHAFQDCFGYEVETICLGEGPLRADFGMVGCFHDLSGKDPQGAEVRHLAQDLRARGVKAAIVNSTVSGLFTATLKEAGLRVVSLVHELPGLMRDYDLRPHAQAIAGNCDTIVFAADLVRQGFSQFANTDESRTVIRAQGLYKTPASRDASVIAATRASLRKRFRLQPDAQIVLGVGYADYRKGIDLFVDAAIRVCSGSEKAAFIWAGHFDQRLEPEVQRRIAEADLSTRILFPGFVAHAEIGEYYLASDLYLLTSREDPFPSVILEALDSGLPVIAFEGVTGCTDLITRAKGQLVEPFNVPALQQGIDQLLANDEERRAVAASARNIIETEYSFRQYAFELAALVDPSLKRVSVVVPNYNHGKYLEERLRSIRQQTYPIFEVIVLDDASSDGSRQWLEANLLDLIPGARFIASEKNSGNVCHQWLKGVAAARGDFIWIAESDDIAEPGFLATALEGFNDPKVVLSYCQSRQIDEKGNILAEHYLDYVRDISEEKWTRRYTVRGEEEINVALAVKNTIPNVSAAVMRREALAKRLADLAEILPDYHVAGDWLVYIGLLSDGAIAFEPRPLNRHRRHDKSVTHGLNAVRHLREIIQVQRWVRGRFPLSADIQRQQDVYAKKVYDNLGLNASEGTAIEVHTEFHKFFGLNQSTASDNPAQPI
jgi:O-antigen biosynthesis protein